MKDRDSESRTQLRSDSDNRSHVSGMSSHPSHSSQSQSTTSQSHSQKSRRGSYDRLQFPRHDLVTIGMLGKLTLQCFFAFIVLPIQNIMAGIFLMARLVYYHLFIVAFPIVHSQVTLVA